MQASYLWKKLFTKKHLIEHYEEKEKKRLVKAKTIDGKLKGINHKFIPEKERKVLRLKQRIQKVENSQQGLQQ